MAWVWATAGGIATLPWRVVAPLQCPSQLFGKSHTPNGGIAAGQLTGVCVCVILPEPLQFHCVGVASSFSVNACLCSKFSLDIRWAEPHRNSHYTLWVPRAAAQSRRGRERPGRTGRAGLPSQHCELHGYPWAALHSSPVTSPVSWRQLPEYRHRPRGRHLGCFSTSLVVSDSRPSAVV